MEKKCFYCEKMYSENTEHVFPDGLGGQKLYMKCVCKECNNKLSTLEGELYRKGIIALMRSIEGVTKLKQRNKPVYFKASTLLIFDEINKIVYEANQNNELKISLKPQIIEINSKFYLEGSFEKDIKIFHDEIIEWQKGDLKMVIEFPNNNKNFTSFIQFHRNHEDITSEQIDTIEKIRKPLILEILAEHELSQHLKPRIFLDNDNNLKIRAQSIDAAKDFIERFLQFISKRTSLRSFAKDINDNGVVYVGFSFDAKKSEQAMVKIMLNCLIHYFPSSINSPSLNDVKSFVNNGTPLSNCKMENRDKIIDSVEKSHNIFFRQHQDFLFLRLSLFNGNLCYSMCIQNLKVLPVMDYSRLLIDYVKRINILQNRNEFLMSFYDNRNKELEN